MSHLIRITTTNQIEVVHFGDTYSLSQLQSLVGGYIEFVSLPDFGLEMVVNEEGKMNGLPLNLPATMYWNRQYDKTLDYIVGDVVLLSNTTTENGDPAGLTETQIAGIIHRVEAWLEDAEMDAFDRQIETHDYLEAKGRI